jgi:hypothetical protein
MSIKTEKKAPYTTTVVLTRLMDWFRDRTPTGIVDMDTVVRAGVPESLATRTIRSLILLELLNENREPSKQWIDMASIRGDEEYKIQLQNWIRSTYSEILIYCDPSSDSYERISEAFRGYEPKGQRSAMASLFIGLWKYSGLESPNAGAVASLSPTKKKSATYSGRPGRLTRPRHNRIPSPTKLDDISPGLVGLLRQIPSEGKTWTVTTRDTFVEAFKAVLNFTVPIGDPALPSVEVGDNQENS